MNVQNSPARVGGGQVDIRTALTVRTWCDEKFAATYRSDREAAIRIFLKDSQLDENLASSLIGDLPASPVGFEEGKPAIHAIATYTGWGDPACLSNGCTSEEWYCPEFTVYCNTQIYYNCPETTAGPGSSCA